MMLDSQEIDALGPATVADLTAFGSWPVEAQRIAARVLRERFEGTAGQYDCDGCYRRGYEEGQATASDELAGAHALNDQLRKALTERAECSPGPTLIIDGRTP